MFKKQNGGHIKLKSGIKWAVSVRVSINYNGCRSISISVEHSSSMGMKIIHTHSLTPTKENQPRSEIRQFSHAILLQTAHA
jgi:hypothetical protein